jgi:gliding motility-associated-like protein
VPGAFIPGAGEIDGVFTLYTLNVGEYELLIFNRWGEVIFHTRDKNKFWDGTYKGQPMSSGIYPWMIWYNGDTSKETQERVKQGKIMLIR